jgi:peptide/nickel transport system substrate-binding protein
MLLRNIFHSFVAVLLITTVVASQAQAEQSSPELTWSLKYDPKTLDPAKVDDQASETLRYLTGGVLLRINRRTQQIEPFLAESWAVSPDGRLVTFRLRKGLRFSDGSPLLSRDVAATLVRLFDPATNAPVAQEFLSAREITIETPDPITIKLHLPKRIMSIGKIFDEIAIEPAGHTTESRITAGSYVVAEYRRGEYIRLLRNPYYWRHDSSGEPLPYLAALRLDVLSNRQQDQMRFVKGRYHLIDSLPSEDYATLAHSNASSMHDLGPSLNTEQMWFNQAPGAPLPAWEKAWFQSQAFRMAVSHAIHRDDLARIAYNGHATPASSFISPANGFWYNKNLKPISPSSSESLQLLGEEGFRKDGNRLFDREGHPVKFSILTNAGNSSREKMANLIQQDLAALGMQVNVVTLDFPALIERLMHSQDYEAALLGLSNVDPDPSSLMNIWMSSSPNHQWNPSEPKPATAWEAEIDQQMQIQATASDDKARRRAIDRVQQIAYDQQPFIYLVYPNMLYAVSPLVLGAELSVLQPGIVSNIDMMRLKGSGR